MEIVEPFHPVTYTTWKCRSSSGNSSSSDNDDNNDSNDDDSGGEYEVARKGR
jgi:hypothetical protein